MTKIIMKKHLLIVLVLTVVLSAIIPFGPGSVRAQTISTVITQLKAELARLQAILLSLTQGAVIKSVSNVAAYSITLTAPAGGSYPVDQDIAVSWNAPGAPAASEVRLKLRDASNGLLKATVVGLGVATSPYNFSPASHSIPPGAYYFTAELWGSGGTLF